MNRLVSRGALVPAFVALAVGLGSQAAPARADDARADLLSVRAGNIAVNSGNCKYTPVKVVWSYSGGWSVDTAFADVHRGGAIIDSQDLSANSNYLWCPYLDGIGVFTFGPRTQVNVHDAEYNTDLLVDDTTGSFAVKYDSRIGLSVTRAGSKVTLTRNAARYALDSNSFIPWSPGGTTLQYLSSSNHWTTLKSFGVASSRLSFSYSTRAVRTYRAITSSSSGVWGRTSGAVRR
jgi:hypothetical protein